MASFFSAIQTPNEKHKNVLYQKLAKPNSFNTKQITIENPHRNIVAYLFAIAIKQIKNKTYNKICILIYQIPIL